MTSPLTAARTAIEAVWNANSQAITEPVIFQHNASEVDPPGYEYEGWLHIEIDPEREEHVAYGAGPRALERVISGTVTLRAFAQVGAGDVALLDLLDRAVDVLRGRQFEEVSFFLDIRYPGSRRTQGGFWVEHAAIMGFESRFRG